MVVTARDRDDVARRKLIEIRRCQRSSWYLATEYLKYEWSPRERRGLTERVHKPIMDWWDRKMGHSDYDAYPRRKKMGLWMARSRHKSTMGVAFAIQQIMRDPCKSHYYFMGTDEHAERQIDAIAKQISKNKRLRELEPLGIDPEGKAYKVFPTNQSASKRWKRTQDLTINRHASFGPHAESPTFRVKGAGGEITSAHIDGIAFLDDIIGRNTVENSRIAYIQRWFENSVYPVCDSKNFFNMGTPWAELSLHQRWMDDPDWDTIVIPGAIAESDEQYAEMMRVTI